MKPYQVVLIAIVVLLLSLIAGYTAGYRNNKVTVETRVDTITIRDTISLPAPEPKIVYVDRVETVTLPAIVNTDTVYIEVQVPIEKKVYETEDYRAEISGFKPSLDKIDLYRQTQIIDRVEKVTIKEKSEWSLGVQAGYGLGLQSGQVHIIPYIGIGIQYNLFNF